MDDTLIERLEAASEGDQRVLLKSAADHVWGWTFAPEGMDPEAWVRRWNRFNRMLEAEAFESAALMLVPKEQDWYVTAIRPMTGRFAGAVYRGEHPQVDYAEAATPALALTAAALRAQAGEKS